MSSNSSLKRAIQFSEEVRAKDGAEIAEPKAKNMDNDEQLKKMKELKLEKNRILKMIYGENINLLDNMTKLTETLTLLNKINDEQKKIWKERHYIKRQKYDKSERGRELSRIRSRKNYYKKKEAKVAQ